MAKTAVVICNYNKAEAVLACIQSVLESKTDDYDIYVVDNASADGSPEKIRARYGDQVTLLVNAENLGGSGGFNTGMRAALSGDYRYIWCLDNDVLVDENALTELVNFMDTHPDTGMAGSKVVHMENTAVIQQFGLTVDYEQFCMEAKYLGCADGPDIPDVVYSDAVAACSVLVRTDVIRKIGLMPEENFLYWDDTEWGVRCNLAGFRVASVGASVVAHAMGAKKESENTFATYYAWRNWILFFLKFADEKKLPALCDTFLSSIFEIIYEGLYRGEENKAKTVMFAYDDALHLRTGKASDDKIFPIDKNDTRYRDLAFSGKNFRIDPCGNEALAEKVAETLQQIRPDINVRILQEMPAPADMRAASDSGLATPASAPATAASGTIDIRLCTSVFQVEDLSLQTVYIDEDENILLTEDDVLMVINYAYSRRTFMSAERPLFLLHGTEIQQTFRNIF